MRLISGAPEGAGWPDAALSQSERTVVMLASEFAGTDTIDNSSHSQAVNRIAFVSSI
jgi:hypothetical protein